MARSQMKVLTDRISRYYKRQRIVTQNADTAAIRLLKLSAEEAKRILESIHPSDRREKIHTSLILLSQKIQVLLEC